MNTPELYSSLKILTESGYKVSSDIITESRTFDVEELVSKYKERIMKLLRQKLVEMLDRLYDGDKVENSILIEIPGLMVSVIGRKEPLQMKALNVKIYFRTSDITRSYSAMKGAGKGQLYAAASGDTNPDTNPVIMMLNLPVIIRASGWKLKESAGDDKPNNLIPFPNVRKDNSTEHTKINGYGRNPERDSMYAKFVNRYGQAGENSYSSYTPYDEYSTSYRTHYAFDVFDFKAAVEQIEKTVDTPSDVIDQLLKKYFGKWFQEVLHHELTHYVQANNNVVDGTENARDYDAETELHSGSYASNELEYEAKLHQKFPAYIDAIQKSKSVSTIAKTIVSELFSNRFKSLPEETQLKYFKEILSLCQAVKAHPEITRYNFNTPRNMRILKNFI